MGSILKKRKREWDESKSPARKKVKKRANFSTVLASKGEQKAVDVSSAAVTLLIDGTANKTLLNGTIPGNGLQNRLGRRIRMKSVRIMGTVIQTQAGVAPDDDLIHVYLVYDAQPNANAYALADLLQVCDSGGTTGTTNYSFQNMSNAKRFKILRHWKRKMEVNLTAFNTAASDSTDYPTPCTIDMYVPLKGLDTQFNTGVTGGVTDITSGALYLMVLGGQATANAQYSFRYQARLRFEDM